MHILVALAVAGPLMANAAEVPNILRNGDFESGLDGWRSQGPAGAYAPGRAAIGSGHVIFKSSPGSQNSHLDQDITLPPNAEYEATVMARAGGGGLRPGLRVSDADWQTLGQAETTADGEWHRLSVIFDSPPDGRVKIQIFGAGRGNRGPFSGETFFDNATLAPLDPDRARAARSVTITVDPAKPGTRIDPRFFGVNALFWIEDDASLRDGRITKALKDMPCGLMRFPGGEVADNFHWRTNTLDNPKDFPFEEGPDQLGFDEFIRWRDEIGAEAICVVNLESGFLHGDLETAIREAADWVRYSNVEKKYGVRYWEIGNESDLAATRYPLGAGEYARAVVRFSEAMKAVDPSILVGALGPFVPDHTAFLDNLTPEGLAGARAMTRGQLKQQKHQDKPLPQRTSPGPAWWPTICEIAKGHFDFAIVHRYDNSRAKFGTGPAVPIRPGKIVAELDAFLRQALGRDVPIALTEWNVNKSATLSPAEHGVSIAEMAMSYLAAGVDLANYWPMRYPTLGNAGFREMLDSRTNEPRPAYRAIQLLASCAGEKIVLADCASISVAALACANDRGDGITVFAASRSARQAMSLLIEVPGFSVAEAVVLAPDSTGGDACVIPLAVSRNEVAWSAELPPLGFARITLSK